MLSRLWPTADAALADVDAASLVASEDRPAHPDRPWVLVNMIGALDGAVAVEGRSGGLGAPADKAMFSALRGIADVVMAGAGTVRTEGYGPPRPSGATRAARAARGQAEAPRIAVVTRSLELDLATPLFTQAERPPLVITCESSPDDLRAKVAGVAEVIVAGSDEVDLGEALRSLRAGGVEVVTCEGGPSLNADLLAADLIDEWALTISPLLVGGGSPRAMEGPTAPAPRHMRLDRLMAGDGLLLGRWLRAD